LEGTNFITSSNMDLQKIWQNILEELSLQISVYAFDIWFKSLEILDIKDNTIVLGTSTKSSKDLLLKKFKSQIIAASHKIYSPISNIEILVVDSEAEQEPETKISKTDERVYVSKENNQSSTNADTFHFNPKYTFDNFIVGGSNQLACAAAKAVAETPSTQMNPLFIYGGVGLGKTHLVHAAGNEILRRYPSKKIIYVSSEKFTNDFINGIKDNSNENFRQKYRNVDVLIIDDIQFIAGKEGIQEEFFHTFNAIRENNGQIILTSDKPPKDINPLEERLKSRFVDGLLVDISNANYETRLAILRQKVQLESIVIDDIVLSNIATKIDTNIRELEGTLNKIVAKATLTHSPITFELAENAIADIIAHKEKVISSDYIKTTVSKYFNIDVKDMDSSKRSNDIAFPRQIAMFLCRELAKMQYKNIGNNFGNRDHSTVMHACSKIELEIKNNKETFMHVDNLKNIIMKPTEV